MAAQNEEGRASREDAALTTRTNFTSNSSADQRARLLAALEAGPVSTLDARGLLDILMPATRVFELRAAGHPITTTRVRRETDGGREHSVALYSLSPAERDLFDEPVDATTH